MKAVAKNLRASAPLAPTCGQGSGAVGQGLGSGMCRGRGNWLWRGGQAFRASCVGHGQGNLGAGETGDVADPCQLNAAGRVLFILHPLAFRHQVLLTSVHSHFSWTLGLIPKNFTAGIGKGRFSFGAEILVNTGQDLCVSQRPRALGV